MRAPARARSSATPLGPLTKELCVERGVEQIDVVREENGDEFYHYEYEGSVMEILYSDNGVNFFMDGRCSDVVPKFDLTEVERQVRFLFEEKDRRREWRPMG
ncbi:hypothetical protein [Rhizobium leguminosarum]|uniref:hypothetical protein n=1 Tax=Rhizobium leguminosarum TaxID=384 RepID=UPI00048830A5|nr:hypothetical protein [Rhizobium leguminosarum]